MGEDTAASRLDPRTCDTATGATTGRVNSSSCQVVRHEALECVMQPAHRVQLECQYGSRAQKTQTTYDVVFGDLNS